MLKGKGGFYLDQRVVRVSLKEKKPMTVYRLSDPNNPKIEVFEFKLGQRVCKRFEDGTLDQAMSGEIVEGFLDEDEQVGDHFCRRIYH